MTSGWRKASWSGPSRAAARSRSRPDRPLAAAGPDVHDFAFPGRGRRQPADHRRHGPEVGTAEFKATAIRIEKLAEPAPVSPPTRRGLTSRSSPKCPRSPKNSKNPSFACRPLRSGRLARRGSGGGGGGGRGRGRGRALDRSRRWRLGWRLDRRAAGGFSAGPTVSSGFEPIALRTSSSPATRAAARIAISIPTTSQTTTKAMTARPTRSTVSRLVADGARSMPARPAPAWPATAEPAWPAAPPTTRDTRHDPRRPAPQVRGDGHDRRSRSGRSASACAGHRRPRRGSLGRRRRDPRPRSRPRSTPSIPRIASTR